MLRLTVKGSSDCKHQASKEQQEHQASKERFLVGFFLMLISATETSAKTLPDPQQKQNAAACNPARSDAGTSGSFVCDPTRSFIASMLPFKAFAFPPKPGVACPKCDGIHAEMWEMQKSWESLWPSWKYEAGDGLSEDQGQGTFLLARMQLGLQSICLEQNGGTKWKLQQIFSALCHSNNIGCYVATANSAPQYHQKGGAATCDKVPFREIVHTVTAYALNGSNMSVELSWNTDQLHPDRPGQSAEEQPQNPEKVIERRRIEVSNSWFIQTAVGLQWAINALPMDLWKSLKLGDTMPGPEGTQVPSAPPYPSITEAFSILMANKTLRYMEASMESWPWVPPPPPPPPTPPPCPGESLQECMKLCPKTEAYKTCVTECLDVCPITHDDVRQKQE